MQEIYLVLYDNIIEKTHYLCTSVIPVRDGFSYNNYIQLKRRVTLEEAKSLYEILPATHSMIAGKAIHIANLTQGDIYTKEEAIQAMKEGKKVRHRYFSPKEWMKSNADGSIFTLEDKVMCTSQQFWQAERQTKGWDIDWSTVKD